MKRIGFGLLCLMLCGTLLAAAGAHRERKPVKASMWLAGSIEVGSTGKVTRYDLEQSSALPPAVAKLIAQSVSAWHFKVAETGNPPTVPVRASMTLRIVASPLENGEYRLSIDAAYFDASDAHSDRPRDLITIRRQHSPTIRSASRVPVWKARSTCC
ncbi:MAG TPA: hypothetical protein VN624_08190 [Rhodanobacter sp.]|nr:hypothetical protein [Rhodanobacter sp.]